MELGKLEKNPEYNQEPVYYCTKCLSLKIMGVSDCDDYDYCDDCGNTNIAQCNIEEWEKMYEKKYGIKLLNK